MDVKLVSNKDDIIRGGSLPIIQSEEPSSAQLFVSTSDAVSYVNGSKFNFYVDILSVFNKAVAFKLKGVCMHKPPNVSNYNKKLRIKHDLGTTSYFYLDVGWYTPTEFANELVNKVGAQFAIDGIADSITCTFNSIKSQFTVSSTGGHNFFFDADSEFCFRGRYLHGFVGEPWTNTPSKSTFGGLRCDLMYTAYASIHCPTLCRGASSSYSMSSNKSIPTWDIIGSVDLLQFNNQDWEGSPNYSTTFRYYHIHTAPKISLRGLNNTVQSTNNLLHIYFLDTNGLDMGDMYNDDQTGYIGDIGAFLFFEIYY